MFRKVLLGIVALLLIVTLGFVVWTSVIPSPLPEAQSALEDSALVEVEREQWLVFSPLEATTDTGFIFYPGGRVSVESYAPVLHQIAEQGFLVVAVPMPLNLAVLSPTAANSVIEAYPEITRWVIGGHSLGGAMAANYIKAHPTAVSGLVLWASYPQASDTLAAFEDLIVASVYATNDGLASVENITNSSPYLPPTTQFIAIDGGNHANFGWYGDQPGDNPATITREAQQAQVLSATLDVLNRAQAQGLN